MATTPKVSNLSGPEKAAILLMSIGEDNAGNVMANMEEREIQAIGNYMSALGDVDQGTMDLVTKEFYMATRTGIGGIGIAGGDFLKAALMKAMDPAKATEILNNISTPGEDLSGGIETLRMLEPKNIAAFLMNEHPQTAAIVLAHIDESVVGSVISELPEEKRSEIMLRLATLERVSPNVIRELDVALQGELRQQGAASGNRLGGVALTAQIIGTMDKDVEAGIMAELEESNPELAQEINDLRFVFEDINKIDDPGIQLILKEIDQAGLPLALKTASDELKEKMFFNMSERASDMLKDDLENLPPTKLADVEKAQKKIIESCKKLEGEGKITVGGAGEELV
jgi:flagellar motor switch protein FliG